MIAGYARQGAGELVFELFEKMEQEGIQPDGVTFLSVLAVCSHVGPSRKRPRAVRSYEDRLRHSSNQSPVSTTVIDLLGRACHLWMAKTMPFPPTGAVWLSLLGNCRKWNNVEIGRRAFEYTVK